MSFTFIHFSNLEAPILIPEIGLTLRVRVPANTNGGIITSIETENAPGFGPPLHRHRETAIEGFGQKIPLDDRRHRKPLANVVHNPLASAGVSRALSRR